MSDVINKFENNLYKKLTDKKNNSHAKLNKSRNYVERVNKYIKENNDKKIDTEKKLYTANKEYNHLLLEYKQSRRIDGN